VIGTLDGRALLTIVEWQFEIEGVGDGGGRSSGERVATNCNEDGVLIPPVETSESTGMAPGAENTILPETSGDIERTVLDQCVVSNLSNQQEPRGSWHWWRPVC
jgi:squalene cyclase